jgi:DamX protein
MAGNDTFKYHAKKSLIEEKSRVVHSLITEERTQKLELLIHLLSNSRQALVVCGPEGIGKTTLLKVLHEHKVESWLYCFVQGNADLSFEEIQQCTAQAIKQDKSDKLVQGMSGVFTQLENRHKKIVLMIDDAGYLVPGLINTIIEYAAANSFLRVIFILTHDDLYVKYKSDNAVDDCYIIEIPTLSERQCGEFLQHLAIQSQAQVSFDAVNDVMIENIYRETQGIPGRIIAELPDKVAAKQSENSLSILIGAVAGLVIIALGLQWYSTSKYNMPTLPASTLAKQNKKSVQIKPVISEQFAGDVIERLTGSGMGTIVNHKPGASQAALDWALCNKQQTGDTQQKITESLVVMGESDDSKIFNNTGLSVSKNSKIIPKPQIEAVIEEQEEVADSQDNGEQWLKKQPVDHYTLQIMVLSNEQSAKDFLKKHPLLKEDLRYLKKVVNGKERFVLLYGSFTSFALANKAKQSLPAEFRNSLARKMSAIKNK